MWCVHSKLNGKIYCAYHKAMLGYSLHGGFFTSHFGAVGQSKIKNQIKLRFYFILLSSQLRQNGSAWETKNQVTVALCGRQTVHSSKPWWSGHPCPLKGIKFFIAVLLKWTDKMVHEVVPDIFLTQHMPDMIRSSILFFVILWTVVHDQDHLICPYTIQKIQDW